MVIWPCRIEEIKDVRYRLFFVVFFLFFVFLTPVLRKTCPNSGGCRIKTIPSFVFIFKSIYIT